ncbi:probable LRR receptor-like serine/threonine-protein kinase At1g07650 [Ziziphus jujuba]|uniref:Probable LRR receptor-like serine/threonine-protein kinase At1g07650 n=1 Tax=Ziziphus jujuba TaxID=326968 RepID=A0ABM3ZWP9_ZIZJJ|nr:probable LRR receptor-like serine/threonine-protein kinase At1g07650 [Ziziphus jujuba]
MILSSYDAAKNYGNQYGILRRKKDEIVRDLKEKENLMELVDPRLGSDYGQEEEVMVAINVALRCTNLSAANRPSMSSVVSMLEGRVAAQGLIAGSAVSTDDSEALRNLLLEMVEENVSESETLLEGNVLESEISILRQ